MTIETACASNDPDSFQDLKKKSLAGIGTLLRRQILVYGLFFLGNVILARILAPQRFGIYAIVSFIMQFFSTFSDVGIGAALIQKKDKLNDVELNTLFWLQQGIVFVVVILASVSAPAFLHLYASIPPSGVWFIRVMAVSFLFASLKTVPIILMERSLDFNRIARVDISESVVFQATAIALALAGFGVWSFIVAALARSMVGLLLTYYMSAWRPAFRYNYDSARELISFGLPYQGNTIISFVKDSVTPLFVGAYAGASAVGYVNWAQQLAFAPLLLSQAFGKVAFPAYARLQYDKQLLQDAIERSIRMMTLILFPITALLFALGPEITHVFFTDKWKPALLAFYFYCTSPFIMGVMLPLYSAILSVGRSDILLKMSAVLLVLEWGLGVPFVIVFGFNGISFSQPIIATLFYFVYRHVLSKETIHFSVVNNVCSQFLAAAFTGAAVKSMMVLFRPSIVALTACGLTGGVLYLGIVYVTKRDLLKEFTLYIKDILGLRTIGE